jgi:hypothetical protein
MPGTNSSRSKSSKHELPYDWNLIVDFNYWKLDLHNGFRYRWYAFLDNMLLCGFGLIAGLKTFISFSIVFTFMVSSKESIVPILSAHPSLSIHSLTKHTMSQPYSEGETCGISAPLMYLLQYSTSHLTENCCYHFRFLTVLHDTSETYEFVDPIAVLRYS